MTASSDFVFAPPARPSLPIEGTSARFPVRRIYCVGQNYGAHAREMGSDPTRTPPFFFSKPADAVRVPGEPVPFASSTGQLDYEIELVVALHRGGENVTPEQALSLVYGYAAGVDLTRRDLQAEAKKGGRPWDAAKGFDASAPLGVLRRAEGVAPPQGRIHLNVNGQTRQDARITDMIWSVAEVIAKASQLWRLEPGDLLFTGTPHGVGPLQRGDRVEGAVEGVGEVSFTLT
ncbi:fumarylacetoacetate hydrolase family protein [Archangium primigenium]|uniref:fumarylacetoacetate hydrolase family protein n=1 Tax=[Archangium] primigenium TaxID=2792470 RepID=UPI00195B24BD|nr:fumarylacetoacetate hydrolase family protein [Archangium primigenium]MBM7116593.1 fumarylacetoacetate hydrolase family protein [Archangium primigenium]